MTLPLSKDSTQAPADSRLDLLKAWLNAHAARYVLELDTLAPASSDASFRRYFRLACKAAEGGSSGTLIAVDAPPPEKCREFVQVAHLLEAANVHVRACWRSISTPGSCLSPIWAPLRTSVR